MIERVNGYLERHKLGLWGGMAAALLVGVAVCLVVNLATAGAATWALYPVVSAVFVLAVWGGFLMGGRKRRLGVAFGVAALLTMPLLLMLEAIGGGGGWAVAIGLPVTCVTVLFVAVSAVVVRYKGIGWWTRLGIIALAALPVTLAIEFATSRYLGMGMRASVLMDVLGNVVVAVALFVIGGYRRRVRRISVG